jgi:dienelactone hydrolase
MTARSFIVFVVLLSSAALDSNSLGISAQIAAPQTVEIPSGNLHLKGYFWKPSGPGPFPAVLFNHGSGGADAAHTGEFPITEAAERLAPLFVGHGYAFLFPFRRGQGLSADQAPFIQDVLQREEMMNGKEARQHLQFVLMTTEQLDDVMAAVAFLKTVPGIDSRRIGVAGHSFGGQLTLLAAERDSTLRAAVTFAAAANSWKHSAELRTCLLSAVAKTNAPIMMIHAANDYDTSPGRALSDELDRLHKLHVLKIYPPVGQTQDDGHNEVYKAIHQWEEDVFKFLEEHVKR